MSGLPDIGPDPLQHPRVGAYIEAALDALSKGICVQQQGVPDQTMLCYRIDVSRIRDECIWRRASHEAAWKFKDKLERENNQLREALEGCAEILTMCREVEGTNSASYDPEEYNSAIDKALSHPAVQEILNKKH